MTDLTQLFKESPIYQEAVSNGSKKSAGGFETYSAADLEGIDFSEPRYAVDGILPEGLDILAGPPKIGKSWLALNKAVAKATGGVALGSINVMQGDVLYMALEDTPRRMKRRIAALLGPQEPFPQRLTITHKSPKIGDGLEAAIAAWVKSHPDARLIIIDTLQRVRKPTNRPQSYAGDYDEIGKLQELAGKLRVAILAVHHTRKAEAEDVFDLVNGTYGISGSADAVLVLKRSRGQADATLDITGRDIEERQIALSFVQGLWHIIGDAQEYALSQERKQIIDLLRQSTLLYPREIAEALEKKGGSVRRLLAKMVEEGQVRVDSEGKYTISQAVNG